jgi:hypothetical protein
MRHLNSRQVRCPLPSILSPGFDHAAEEARHPFRREAEFATLYHRGKSLAI